MKILRFFSTFFFKKIFLNFKFFKKPEYMY